LDATVGAAVWLNVGPPHPGFRTGRSYCCFEGTHITAAIPAIDTLYVYPFILPRKVSVQNMSFRVTTGGAASSCKVGIWASKNALPFGAPIMKDNTGVATATTSATATFTASGSLTPNTYWVGVKCTGTPPTTTSIPNTDYRIERMIGRVALNGNTAITGLSIASTYSANMPTFDGTETWTEVFTAGIPIVRVGL
jgi:hypothetical protein